MRDILLIDKSQFGKHEPYFKGALLKSSVVDMTGHQVSGVLKALETNVSKNRDRVRFLVFVDHGNIGFQQLGNGQLTFNAGGRKDLQRLAKVNCTRIYFLGCQLAYKIFNQTKSVGSFLGKQMVTSQAIVDYKHNGVFSKKKFVRYEANGMKKDEPHQISRSDLTLNIEHQLLFRP